MKLAKVSDDVVLDLDDVQSTVWDDDKQAVVIMFKSNENYIVTTNKKVLDAISGSEEDVKSKNNNEAEIIIGDGTNENPYKMITQK